MTQNWLEPGRWTDGLVAGGAGLVLVGIQTTLVLVAILAIAALLRERTAGEQKLIYRCGLIATTLVLLGSIAGLPRCWSVPLSLPAAEAGASSGPGIPETASPSTVRVDRVRSEARPAGSASVASTDGSRPDTRELRVSGLAIALAIWAMGALVLSVRLLLGLRSIAALRRRCIPCETPELLAQVSELTRASGRRAPALLVGKGVGSPLVVGPLRPAILLPRTFLADFSPEQRRAVLAHEFGHVTGRDLEWSLLTRLLCIALWFQPLLWLLAARLEQANEEASDAAVLEAGCARQDYADLLVSLAERLLPGTRATQVMGMSVLPIRSSLGRRVAKLFSAERALRPVPSHGFRLGVGLGSLAAVALSASLGIAAPPPAIPLEQARKEAQFPLVDPQGLPVGAKLEAVRVYKIRLSPIQDAAASPPEPFRGYGLSIRPDGNRVWIRAMAHSVAARAGIPSRDVELFSVGGKPLGGPFPKSPPPPVKSTRRESPTMSEAQLRPTAAEARRLDDLIRRLRQEPLQLTYDAGRKAVRRVTLARREPLPQMKPVNGFFPDKTAVFAYTLAGKSFNLYQIPPASHYHLLKVLRPLTIVEEAAQLIEFKSASRTTVGKQEAWTLGPEEAPSVFWSGGAVDFWLENPAGALNRSEILAIVKANGGR